MAKTIYKVEGASSGEPSPGPDSPSPEAPYEPAYASPPSSVSLSPKAKRRRLIWVLLVIAVLTVAMIVAIALLGASESPAVGTVADPETVTTFAYIPVTSPEPVGTSTTMGALIEVPDPTTTSAGSTSTTALTHVIAEPARIVIPALKVDAKLVPVGLKASGEMEIPSVGLVGWYTPGPIPGAAGPAVLVSHVSWAGKKGAFYALKDLKAGDEVRVYESSGDYAVFQVDSLETILKTNLPTDRIWNKTEQSVIRLITCGGVYNSKTGHYLSNVIVYGHLVK
jgi:LPXTG-site transpeptidase (sortase) family protein